MSIIFDFDDLRYYSSLMDFYRNVLYFRTIITYNLEFVILKIQLMGGSHSKLIKIATVNYSGITDSPFEFQSNDTPELTELNKIFKLLFQQLISALQVKTSSIPQLRQKQEQKFKDNQNMKNTMWKRLNQLGNAKENQIKNFMEQLKDPKQLKEGRQITKDFKWGINDLDKNMHKGRYCPQYRQNVGIENGRFNSMSTFFSKWNFEFDKNKAYSKVSSKSSIHQRNVCMVYDYIIYKTIVEYCYNKFWEQQKKIAKQSQERQNQKVSYSIAPREFLQNGRRKGQVDDKQIRREKYIRRAILQLYEQLMQKYHSMPYLKHQKKYQSMKAVIQQNDIIFLQDISDQLLTALKGEGDLTIADRLGAKDDCIIVINNKKLKFANIYDAEKITDRNKRKNKQGSDPQLLTIEHFNYFIFEKQKNQRKYVPAVCFIDNFLLLSLRFTSKETKAIQIYKFFDHMMKINQKYPQLFIIIGGDFNCDLTTPNKLIELAKMDKVSQYFRHKQIDNIIKKQIRQLLIEYLRNQLEKNKIQIEQLRRQLLNKFIQKLNQNKVKNEEQRKKLGQKRQKVRQKLIKQKNSKQQKNEKLSKQVEKTNFIKWYGQKLEEDQIIYIQMKQRLIKQQEQNQKNKKKQEKNQIKQLQELDSYNSLIKKHGYKLISEWKERLIQYFGQKIKDDKNLNDQWKQKLIKEYEYKLVNDKLDIKSRQRKIKQYRQQLFDDKRQKKKKVPQKQKFIEELVVGLQNKNQIREKLSRFFKQQFEKVDKTFNRVLAQQQLSVKYNKFQQHFNISQTGDTTIKQRSWLQSQSNKAEGYDISQRDFLISNHQIINYRRDGTINIDDNTILPSNKHPFDHFFILGEIDKQSPKIKRESKKLKEQNSSSTF